MDTFISWREIQRKNFRKISDLAAFLNIDSEKLNLKPSFPLNLPVRLANKMAKGTLDDPLVRQFVPLPDEKKIQPGYSLDPVQDARFCKSDKLLQKYAGRALFLINSACVMHCRFCFRQNFDYAQNLVYENEIALIRNDPTLHEVILSGGDPLSLSDRALGQLLDQLSEISHIKLIRFHTRFPIGIPERIDSSFLALLAKCPKQVIFVVHANHPDEFDEEIFQSLKELQKLGIPVLLQSVLLKDINDDFSTLKRLFETSVQHGIIPYYLHSLDPVVGTGHFEVAKEKGSALIEELRNALPGYAVPRFVQEIPGEKSKTLL